MLAVDRLKRLQSQQHTAGGLTVTDGNYVKWPGAPPPSSTGPPPYSPKPVYDEPDNVGAGSSEILALRQMVSSHKPQHSGVSSSRPPDVVAIHVHRAGTSGHQRVGEDEEGSGDGNQLTYESFRELPVQRSDSTSGELERSVSQGMLISVEMLKQRRTTDPAIDIESGKPAFVSFNSGTLPRRKPKMNQHKMDIISAAVGDLEIPNKCSSAPSSPADKMASVMKKPPPPPPKRTNSIKGGRSSSSEPPMVPPKPSQLSSIHAVETEHDDAEETEYPPPPPPLSHMEKSGIFNSAGNQQYPANATSTTNCLPKPGGMLNKPRASVLPRVTPPVSPKPQSLPSSPRPMVPKPRVVAVIPHQQSLPKPVNSEPIKVASTEPTKSSSQSASKNLTDVIHQLEKQMGSLAAPQLPHPSSTATTNDDSSEDSDTGSDSQCSTETALSSGSVDFGTLPFANENVGTIKQRNAACKPSIMDVNIKGGGSEGEEEDDDDDDDDEMEETGTMKRNPQRKKG